MVEMCSNDTDLQPLQYADMSRRDQRSLLFHLLYAADSYEYETSISSLIDMFNRGFGWDIPLDCEIALMAQQIVEARTTLDEQLKPFLHNWRFDRIGLCTKLILRMSLWELQQKDAIPSIIINEAIEIAKCFAEKDAYKFINGVLDEIVSHKTSK